MMVPWVPMVPWTAALMVFKELNISLPVFLFKYWRILFRMDKTVGFKKINLAFTLLTHAHTLHTYYTLPHTPYGYKKLIR